MGNIQLLVWVVNVFGKIGLDKIVKAVEMLQPSVGILVPVNFGCHGVMKTFHSPKEPSNFLVLLNVHHSFVTYSLHITRYCCRTLWGDGYACTTHALKNQGLQTWKYMEAMASVALVLASMTLQKFPTYYSREMLISIHFSLLPARTKRFCNSPVLFFTRI